MNIVLGLLAAWPVVILSVVFFAAALELTVKWAVPPYPKENPKFGAAIYFTLVLTVYLPVMLAGFVLAAFVFQVVSA